MFSIVSRLWVISRMLGVGLYKAFGFLALAGAVMAVAGCGTSTSLLGAKSTTSPVDTATTGPAAIVRGDWKMVALEQLHGAPDNVRAHVIEQISRDAVQHGMILRSDSGKFDYKLRGYLLVENVKSNAKVVYVWDVLNATGARVSRISGEETVAIAAGAKGDRWASVPPAVLAMVAEKAVSALAQASAAGAAATVSQGGLVGSAGAAALPGGSPSMALR
jgi:hypothetical protein